MTRIEAGLLLHDDARAAPDFLAEAEAVADRLAVEAVTHRDHAAWLGRRIGPGPPVVERLGADLFAGNAGVALFLLEAARQTQKRPLLDLAQAGLRHALRFRHAIGPEHRFGFYTGQVGLAWACHRVHLETGEAAWSAQRDALVRELWDGRHAPAQQDLMSGAGGAIPVLLRMAEDAGGHRACEELALHLGHRLLRTAHVAEDRCWWPGSAPGFAHGASGIAYGLAHLARWTGTQEFEVAAMGAHCHDDALPDAGAWCDGAPGIGLARAAAYRLFRNHPFLRDGVRQARARTEAALARWSRAPGQDASLAHGLAGGAEALWAMDAALGHDDPPAASAAWAAWGLNRYGHRLGIDWPSAAPHGQHPGLMTGAAGVGLWLLRHGAPGKVESLACPPAPRFR